MTTMTMTDHVFLMEIRGKRRHVDHPRFSVFGGGAVRGQNIPYCNARRIFVFIESPLENVILKHQVNHSRDSQRDDRGCYGGSCVFVTFFRLVFAIFCFRVFLAGFLFVFFLVAFLVAFLLVNLFVRWRWCARWQGRWSWSWCAWWQGCWRWRGWCWCRRWLTWRRWWRQRQSSEHCIRRRIRRLGQHFDRSKAPTTSGKAMAPRE